MQISAETPRPGGSLMPTGSLHSSPAPPTPDPPQQARAPAPPPGPALQPRVSPPLSAPRGNLSPHPARGWRPGPPHPCPRLRGAGVQPPPPSPKRGDVPAGAASPPQRPASLAGPRRRQSVIRGRGKLSEPPFPGPFSGKRAPCPSPTGPPRLRPWCQDCPEKPP